MEIKHWCPPESPVPDYVCWYSHHLAAMAEKDAAFSALQRQRITELNAAHAHNAELQAKCERMEALVKEREAHGVDNLISRLTNHSFTEALERLSAS